MDNLVSENAASLPGVTKKKHGLLPVLIVLFVISYALMCTLVVEQGSTIDAQRFLIRELLGDSTQLSQLKGRAFQQKQAEDKAQAEAQSSQQGNIKAQPKPQAPDAQSAPRANSKDMRKSGKLRRPLPQKPPQDTSEMADERRNLISI